MSSVAPLSTTGSTASGSRSRDFETHRQDFKTVVHVANALGRVGRLASKRSGDLKANAAPALGVQLNSAVEDDLQVWADGLQTVGTVKWTRPVRGFSMSVSTLPDLDLGDTKFRRINFLCLLIVVTAMDGIDGHMFAMLRSLDQGRGFDENLLLTVLLQGTAFAGGAIFWSVLASRHTLSRRRILILGSIMWGVLTVLTSFVTEYFSLLLTIRVLVYFSLSAHRPITRGMIADVYANQSSGAVYGLLFFGYSCGSVGASSLDLIPGLSTYRVLQLSGLTGLLIALLLTFRMEEPKITASHKTVREELATVVGFLRIRTLLVMVVQGMFGAVPWRVMEERLTFLKLIFVDGTNTARWVHRSGQLITFVGSYFGGVLGDRLARRSILNGRIFCAQISVFGGIPLSFFFYMVAPTESPSVLYYFFLSIAMGLVTPWTDSGVNPPMLCSMAQPEERTLLLATHWALEQAGSGLGTYIYYLWQPFNAETSDRWAMGSALFWMHCIPWLMAGLIYSTLHWVYPRDIEFLLLRINAVSDEIEERSVQDMHSRSRSVDTESLVSMTVSELSAGEAKRDVAKMEVSREAARFM